MKYLVLWSGGVDSTYLIKYLLDRNQEDVVITAYITLQNNRDKSRMEKAAIKRMVPFFKKNYGNRFTFWPNTTSVLATVREGVFIQPLLWTFLGLILGDCDTLALGYILGDDAVSYTEDLLSLKKVISQFCNPMPSLCFPLLKHTKEQTWRGLPKELQKETVWCELPVKVGKKFQACSTRLATKGNQYNRKQPCIACRKHQFHGLKHP